MVALLLTYLRPLWVRVLTLGLLVAATTAFQLLNPQVLRFYLDTAQAGGPQVMGLLVAAALAYLAIGFVQKGTGLLTSWNGDQIYA
jgi:hypothetical protein